MHNYISFLFFGIQISSKLPQEVILRIEQKKHFLTFPRDYSHNIHQLQVSKYQKELLLEGSWAFSQIINGSSAISYLMYK